LFFRVKVRMWICFGGHLAITLPFMWLKHFYCGHIWGLFDKDKQLPISYPTCMNFDGNGIKCFIDSSLWG
jgi:hypothetical protein